MTIYGLTNFTIALEKNVLLENHLNEKMIYDNKKSAVWVIRFF